MKSKNKKMLDEFTAYCEEHPEMRFWQALRAFVGCGYIYTQTRDEPLIDTFYV